MNKAPIVILTLMMLSAGHAQETAKPLSEEALTRTIDAIGIGDPLTKQPLSIGDDMPRKEEPEKPEKKAKGDTEIIADSLTFDNRIHTAIFQGNVVVIDPEFNVKCDKLTAYLKAVDKSNGAASAKPAAKPAATPVSGKPEAPARGGGLEKARN
ncbi:MAG: LptA/OstA family protein [Verrucomicrobiota bacterium]